MLVERAHGYVSIDAVSLVNEAERSMFKLTPSLKKMIAAIGGPSSDLKTNLSIGAAFIDQVRTKGCAELEWKAILSEVFASHARGRATLQDEIVTDLIRKLRVQDQIVIAHSAAWLLGHSIGTPRLAAALQEFYGRRMEEP
jgi:hypothetical protein